MHNNFSDFIFDPLTWFTFNILGNLKNFGCQTLCKDLKASTIPHCSQIKLKRLLAKQRHGDWMTNTKDGSTYGKIIQLFFNMHKKIYRTLMGVVLVDGSDVKSEKKFI